MRARLVRLLRRPVAVLAPLFDRGAGKDPVEFAHNRMIVAAGLFAFAFLAIALRLGEVMLISGGGPERPVARAATIYSGSRADILDRNGRLLATSLDMQSVFADPRQILDADSAARALASVFPGSDAAVLKARLSSGKSFVYIKREVTPREAAAVNALGIPGVFFQRTDKRIYPAGRLTAHSVGFTDIDNRGLAGIEKSLDERLRSNPDPLETSLDLRLQAILRDEIVGAMTKFSAIGAAGMIMDARTGEVLALASLPDFDPNEPGAAPADTRFNRITLGVYEMGSTFKIFNTAMALEAGTTTMRGGYDATYPIRIGRFTISDYHAKRRWLSVPEIFMYSSNIGSAKMAVDVGPAGQKAFLGKLGLLEAAHIELPEIGKPQFPTPWRPVNVMTIAFGHGVSVSPLNLVGAVAAVVNGGVMVHPTILRRPADAPIPGVRVMREETSQALRRLMRLVVEKGTGKEAEVAGYVVGGKTGTAEKVGGRGGYRQKSLVSSFVGAYPIHDPRYVVMVMLDEPKGTKETYGYATGGWVAAPSVRRVIARMGPLYGLPPVDEAAPEIRRLIDVDLGSGAGAGGTKVAAE